MTLLGQALGWCCCCQHSLTCILIDWLVATAPILCSMLRSACIRTPGWQHQLILATAHGDCLWLCAARFTSGAGLLSDPNCHLLNTRALQDAL